MNKLKPKTHKQKANEKRAGIQDGLLDSLNEFDKINLDEELISIEYVGEQNEFNE